MTRSSRPLPPIVVDTREQLAWTFASDLVRGQLFGGEQPIVTRCTLTTGDYSVLGLEHRVSVERKALEDFVGTLFGKDHVTGEPRWPRFVAEMRRMATYDVRAIIVEASRRDVERMTYRSNVRPQSVIGRALSIVTDHGVPVIWSGSREMGEYDCAWILRRAWEQHLDRIEEEAR